jgi:hypothetical protein
VLAFLQPQVYPNGEAVASTDYLQEVGADYVEQAREMHARPGYADLIHGHVAVDSTGTRWLQYWLFMYYDDPGFLGFGTHEGDIEMIQVRLDENDQPTAASYSQHRTGVRADWSQLELASSPDGPVPVTYSARGSHANLLRAGDQISLRSFLPDHNDGGGYRVRPELVVLSESQTPWCVWPGAWGSTRASGPLGDAGIYANSPAALTNHRAWSDPSGFHESCSPPDDLPPAGAPTAVDQPSPPAPQLSVLPSATATVAQFTLPSQVTVASPEKVVVGLASPAAGVPAITATVDVRGPTGVVELPLPPGGAPLELRATTHAANGLASPTTTVTL